MNTSATQSRSAVQVVGEHGSRRAHERFAVLVSLGVSAAAIVGMAGLVFVVGWTQRQITVDFASVPAVSYLDSEKVIHGRTLFSMVCVACHGEDGRGRPGLGKDLTASPFVKATSDGLLRVMIKEGRPANHPLNTTKVLMPPKGGNDALTDEDIADVVLFLRGLQSPAQVAPGVSLAAKAPAPTEAEIEAAKAAALTAAGGDAELAEYIASGTKIFNTTCIACHGPGGIGIKGNGKALAHNEFIKGLDDDGLLAFVKKGRDPSDPKNTTGVGMPPKGGNPALSDDDLLDVISYLRTLQGDAASATATKP